MKFELVNLISTLFTIYGYLILIRIVLSWINVNPYQPWVRLLFRLTEPFLEPFRALVPAIMGIDFSPILAFFVLHMLRKVAVYLLLML